MSEVIHLPRRSPAPPKATGEPLSDGDVKRLTAPASGNRITYDKGKGSVSGFGCRVTAAGTKSYILNYRTKAGRERRYTIGSADNWTTGAARIKARELRKQVDNGEDPLGNIEEERAAPTLHDLCDRFENEFLPTRRESTQVDYRSMLSRHIRPHWGKHDKVADVTTDEIEALHRKISKAGNPYRANRVVAVVSKIFSLAVRWRMRADNPARGIERNYEAKRKRYLNGEELTALVNTLAAHPDQHSANIFRLLLLTGARRGEVLSMRWADVDLKAGKWLKPGSTTKQKTEHEVPLSAPGRQLLGEIAAKLGKKPLGEFVFPGAGKSEHVVEVKRQWRHICKAAGISGLRIHDLRHNYASILVSGGASLELVGALLGHNSAATTHRYSHLFDDPQRAAAEKVGAIIVAAGKKRR
jgi:integrase